MRAFIYRLHGLSARNIELRHGHEGLGECIHVLTRSGSRGELATIDAQLHGQAHGPPTAAATAESAAMSSH